jgi:hypothetical protein
MPDEIIEELWQIKDSMAREQGNDVRKLAAYLQGAHPENSSRSTRRSVAEVLNDGPGQRLFQNAKEVDDYITEERASWDR